MIPCYVTDNHNDWDKNLSKISCALRTQIHEITTYSPYYVIFGRHIPSNVHLIDDSQLISFDINQEKLARERRNDFGKLYPPIKRLESAAKKNQHYYDMHHRDVLYDVGLRVYRKNYYIKDCVVRTKITLDV